MCKEQYTIFTTKKIPFTTNRFRRENRPPKYLTDTDFYERSVFYNKEEKEE